MTFGLNYYPYDEISDENRMLDTLKCIEKDTDWDCEKGIKDVIQRNDFIDVHDEISEDDNEWIDNVLTKIDKEGEV